MKTTDNSLLVNYLRGNLVGEYGKPLEVVSRSNVLGLHFISSNSGYGIGKYGFNGTITAGEQMAEFRTSVIITVKFVIVQQMQVTFLPFNLLHYTLNLQTPREPIKGVK